MRHHRQSKANDIRARGWWALLAAAVSVLIGATGVAAQAVAPRPSQRPASRPFREPPGLLSAAEVERGLAARHRALRERFLAHEQRRRQEPAEAYAIPAPAPNTPVSPRSDAPGGEFDAAGVR